MSKVSYMLRVLRGASLKKMGTLIDRVQQHCDWSRPRIFFDMVGCALRYGAGYNDYANFVMYKMTPAQRATVVTRTKYKKISEYLNKADYIYIFDDKSVFNKRFKDFIRRDFIDLSEADETMFERFMEGKEIVFAKPNSSESGKGIERLKKSDFASPEEMFRYVKDPAKNFGVLEQEIIQHEAMKELYPMAVNTLRIATVVENDGKSARCLYVVCKMGNEGKFVDNVENSGLFGPVDTETGDIYAMPYDTKSNPYEYHPYTHVKIVGHHIPYVKEAVELAKRAALVVPQMRHIGWDVCIMPDGPAIVEGNNYPGYDFFRPEWSPDMTGMLPVFKEFVPGLK